MFYENSGAFIVQLPLSSYPTAIPRLISKAIVIPFQRQTLRSLAHIREEVSEFQPALTYFNSAPTVILIVCVYRVGASLDHAVPGIVGSSTMPDYVMPMLPVSSSPTIFASLGSFGAFWTAAHSADEFGSHFSPISARNFSEMAILSGNFCI